MPLGSFMRGLRAWWHVVAVALVATPSQGAAKTGLLSLSPLPQDEAAALTWLRTDESPHCDPEDAAWLVRKLWWAAAREMAEASHRHNKPGVQCTANLDIAIRREVGRHKREADALLLALAEQERIGVVRCAFQWAQNSTTVFLSVKYSHRWSSPGALKVHGEEASVTDCCFNFSAHGEHSQLRKRYMLDLHMFSEVNSSKWSWQQASAGRFTVEIWKQTPAKWPRLTKAKEQMKTVGVWDAMYARWGDELNAFDRAQEEAKREAKENRTKVKAEADDEALHDESRDKCLGSPRSPFGERNSIVQLLCQEYWPPTMPGKRGQETTWLVLFYSPQALKCKEHDKECITTHDRWTALQRKVEGVSKAKLGVVDCDFSGDFCKKQKVGDMPFVRRYKDGKRKNFHGEWDVDSVMSFILGDAPS